MVNGSRYSKALLYTLAFSIASVILGTSLLFLKAPSSVGFTENPLPLNTTRLTPWAMFMGIAALDPTSLVGLGLLALMSIPLATLVMGLVDMVREGDSVYVALATIALINVLVALLMTPYLAP